MSAVATLGIPSNPSQPTPTFFETRAPIGHIALPRYLQDCAPCAHMSEPKEAKRPEDVLSNGDVSSDSNTLLTRMHLAQGAEPAADSVRTPVHTAFSDMPGLSSDSDTSDNEDQTEGSVLAIVAKAPRTNLLKPTIMSNTSDKPRLPKKKVSFNREPSPRRTSATAMLAKERLLDAEEHLLPSIGNMDLTRSQGLILQKKQSLELQQKELLEPTYFAAYVVPKALSPFSKEYEERRCVLLDTSTPERLPGV